RRLHASGSRCDYRAERVDREGSSVSSCEKAAQHSGRQAVMWRARHLQDDRLYECYVAGQTGEPVDPPSAEHLADCASCQDRLAELSAFMGDIRLEADAQIDEAYSADALHAQQAQILRRIEHLGHPAHVISFPKHQASGSAHGQALRVAPRWLAAAA